jgi:glucokinase
MQQATVLAGDIGGTKTHLALYALASGRPRLLREARFASRDFNGLDQLAGRFLDGERVAAAAFGIAGPVVDGEVRTTNLPWHVLPRQLEPVLGTTAIHLLNDLEATALGALHLPADRLLTLQAGHARPGNIAVIAAGTGLGQAYLHWDGARHRPQATEGGHVEFGPTTEDDDALLRFARTRFEHVSWERVVSGQGFSVFLEFMLTVRRRTPSTEVRERLARGDDPGAVVGEAAVAGSCEVCAEIVRWFWRLYGAQAGNLALSVLSLGGVLVGGGIVLRLLPVLDREAFLAAFLAKGRYRALMASLPVQVILEPTTALLGARRAALDLLHPNEVST